MYPTPAEPTILLYSIILTNPFINPRFVRQKQGPGGAGYKSASGKVAALVFLEALGQGCCKSCYKLRYYFIFHFVNIALEFIDYSAYVTNLSD